MPPEICPNCGASVPASAKACPQCGSDEETGWSAAAAADGLSLPDENFNYDEFVKREFGKEGHVPRGIHWFWWIAAVALVIGFVLLLFK